jgi:ketosteroid isomerase-like protein
MAEHPNVKLVRDAYAAFEKADLDAALADLAGDAVFHFNGEGRSAVTTRVVRRSRPRSSAPSS